MAMRVAGTMTLGDLIDRACAMGARVEKAGLRVWSEEFEGWYVPEYLVRGEFHVPLPTTNDRDYMLDAEIVDFIRTRLRLPVWPVEKAGPPGSL